MKIKLRRRHQAGFTLIEILVAFAIIGLASGALLSVFSSGPGRIAHANNKRIAVMTARSLLALIGRERPLEEGQWQGQLNNGETWELIVKRYEKQNSDNRISSSLATPYKVTVRASAGSGANAATSELETVRLKVAIP